jgi:predicted dehydrogenase
MGVVFKKINMKVCNVVFIGAGYMTNEHAKAFSDIDNVQLLGIYSKTESKSHLLAKKYGIKKVYLSIQELYESTKADLVVISVPELSVHDVAIAAFNYPWTCLIEKPIGYNFSDAESIANIAIKLNRKVFVALNRRHYSSTRKVLEDLKNTDGIRLIHVNDQEDIDVAIQSGQPQLVVENWMYANSIHLIDYFTFLLRGKITKIENIIPWISETPGYVMAKIETDSGDVGIYTAIWNAPGPWSVTICTKAKRFEMRPLEFASVQLYGKRTVDVFKVDSIDNDYKAGIRYQALLVIKVSLGENVPELPTIVDALKTMQLVKNLYFGTP